MRSILRTLIYIGIFQLSCAAVIAAIPTVSVTAPSGPTNASTLAFTVTFSEGVTGFSSASDITISGSAGGTLVGAIVATADPAVYTVNITGMAAPAGNVSLDIPAAAAKSISTTEDNTASPVTGTVAWDGIAPTVTINKKIAQADPTNASPVLFTVAFSEPINAGSFVAGDIDLSSSTTGGTLTPSITLLTASTFEISVAITGSPISGDIIAAINASTVLDPAGNNNAASTSTDNVVAYDITGPSVTINKKIGQADPTNVGPILFTVVFDEVINAGSFTAGDINLSASTTGGTLTPSITLLTPSTFEVSVAVTGSPVSGDIIASINASTVQDPLGNNNSASTSTDNIVAFTLTAPTVTSPTVTTITENSATLGGNITFNGGSAITERGTVWKTSSPVTIADNKLAEGGTTTGVFSHSRTSLPSAVQIFYAAYGTNAIGTALSPESSFFTLAITPTNHPASLTATAVSSSQINLTFPDASTLGNAKGYIILRNASIDPTVGHLNVPNDGLAPGALTFTNGTVLAGFVTSGTTFSDMGLTSSTQYRYLIIPYNVDNVITPTSATYNYKTGGSPVGPENDITFSANSDIVLNGGTTATFNYENFQGNPITGTGNSVQLAQLQLRDGGASNDADNKKTTLTTLTLQITNYENVRRIALYDAGSVLTGTEQPVTGPTVSFTIPAGDIEANDNNTDDFLVLATFNSVGIDDQESIQITVIASTTASSAGSGLAATNAGGAFTSLATNILNVVAEKVVFVANPPNTPISPATFSLSVKALDHPFNNLDKNETGQVTLSKSGGNPSATLSASPQALNPNLIAGEFNWTSLSINLSGTYTLTGAHSSITDASGSVTITSNGVNVTPGTVPLTPICYSGAFQTLSNITIAEVDPADFALGAGQIFSMVLPAGFIFDTSVTPMPGLVNVTGTEMNTPVAASYVGNSIVRIGYTITGTTNLNSLVISGLKVKYTGNTPSSGNILRYGGSAVQAGNMDADGKNHGTLTAAPSGTVVTFDVDELPGQPVQNPSETRFSINTASVKLIGTPSGGVFTGNGVILSPTNGYTFNPTSVGVGNNYVVLYTYNEPGGQQCQVTATKTFEVYASVIGNLNLQYCTNGTPSTGLNVPEAQLEAIYGANFSFHDFVYFLPGTGYTPITPVNNIFDPTSTNYVTTTNIYGGVYIYYRIHDDATPLTPQFAQYQFVVMSLAPSVSFTTPGGQTSFCADETPVILTGTPANSNTTSNDFFSANPIGQSGSISSAGSPVVWSFSPTAVTGVTSAVSQTFNITYTYKDPYSLCSNTSAPIAITVHARPLAVPTTDISPTGTPPTLVTCVNGSAGSFSGTPISGTTYKWYTDNPPTDLRKIGNNFTPDGLFNNTAAGNTNFYVTRTINGCESTPSPTTLRVTVNPQATVNAGSDATTCAGTDQLFTAFAASFGGAATSAQWTIVSGTGSIKDNSNVILALPASFATAAKYTPSPADITAGTVILRLTTDDPDLGGPCTAVFDDVVITITSVATASALANNQTPLVVCSGDQIILNGIIGGAASSLEWFKGSISPGNSLGITPNTEYSPTPTELLNGANISFILQTDDPAGPCIEATSTVNVTINKRAQVNAGLDLVKCAYETIQLNGSIPVTSSATSFTWSGGAGSFSPDPNTGNATYTPSAAERNGANLILTLTSDDADGPGGPCPAEVDNVSLSINPRPAIPSATQPAEYCVGDLIANLQGFGSGLKWYDDIGLTNQVGVGNSFASGVSNVAEISVPFYVTQTILGCESFSTSVSVIVNPLPVPNFSALNYCLGDFMAFTDASTVNSGTVAAWDWRFDDGLDLAAGTGTITAGTHNGQTTGTYNNPSHRYTSLGNYNVRLTAVSNKGCVQSITKPFQVGPVPNADFTIQDVCDQDNTQFTYTGTVPGLITTWAWNFGDAGSGLNNTAAVQNPNHAFTGVNTYPVSLQVTTNLGCQDSFTKNAFILPYVKSFPYQESFEGPSHGWVTEGLNSNALTSWQLNTPNGSVITSAANGSKAWFTRDNTLGTYNNSERSVLYGPCFDMTQLQRPVLSLQYWNNTDLGNDGAYMEFSTNNGQSWQRLGLLNEGLEWYNRAAVLGLSQQNGIGQAVAQIGWSGNTAKWTAGKHNMDNLGTETKLRMRFVFGSNPDNPSLLDGFAMDNFVMETRNRVILAENFTSKAATNATTNNQNFNSFKQSNPTELVKLQYHIDLPDADDINRQNSADPNARAAFYGLTNSNSIVPRIFLDGASENPGNFTGGMGWADSQYNSRSLVTAPVAITVSTVPTDNDKLAVTADIKALNAITSGKLAVFIVVVEKAVGSEQFVVRKLLPSATGELLTLPMALNQSITIAPTPWEVKNINDINQLAVLAFVQDLETRDILQAAYLPNPGNLPSVTTSLGDLLLADRASIYPNPADDELTIQLPTAAPKRLQLQMVDQVGRVVNEHFISEGERSKTISTRDLAGGIYLLQLGSGNTSTRKKIMIVHGK